LSLRALPAALLPKGLAVLQALSAWSVFQFSTNFSIPS